MTKETNVKLALEWVVKMVTSKIKIKKLSPAYAVNLVINRFSKITFGNIDVGDDFEMLLTNYILDKITNTIFLHQHFKAITIIKPSLYRRQDHCNHQLFKGTIVHRRQTRFNAQKENTIPIRHLSQKKIV